MADAPRPDGRHVADLRMRARRAARVRRPRAALRLRPTPGCGSSIWAWTPTPRVAATPRGARSPVSGATTSHRAWALLIVGAAVGGHAQTVLWVMAAVIDYAGPSWLTRERSARAAAGGGGALRRALRAGGDHLPRRIDRLDRRLSADSHAALRPRLFAVALGAIVTAELWFVYFDRASEAMERLLRDHEDPVLAAADGYSYLHLRDHRRDHHLRGGRQGARRRPGGRADHGRAACAGRWSSPSTRVVTPRSSPGCPRPRRGAPAACRRRAARALRRSVPGSRPGWWPPSNRRDPGGGLRRGDRCSPPPDRSSL